MPLSPESDSLLIRRMGSFLTMYRLKHWCLAALIGVAIALLVAPDAILPGRAVAEVDLSVESPGAPIVVELFTSQGCSSCPPADNLLGELAKHPGVVALSMHVDYWDYIGWKDPYADPELTRRQREYARNLGLRYVYTPQMVVDGRFDVAGLRRSAVLDVIEKSARERKSVEVRFDQERGTVVIPAGEAPTEGATVWLAAFDSAHETSIPRGENAGRTLKYHNVVRSMTRIGAWNGEAMEIPLDMAATDAAGRDGCAVIIQQGAQGPVLGAAMLALNGPS